MSHVIARAAQWLRNRLWDDDLASLPRWRALGLGTARVLVYAWRSFSQNLVGTQAAGLTMLSLLGLVPLIWLGLGVAEMLGFADTLTDRLTELEQSKDLSEALREAVRNFNLAVQRVSFTALGMLGTVILVYSGYTLFITVEDAFNHVWKARHRSWYLRIGSFVGLVVIVPVLILAAVVVESALAEGSLVKWMREELPWLAWLYDAGVKFTPAVMVWIALTLVYKWLPSTKVFWRPAALAALLVTVVVITTHGIYVRSTVSLALNNQVYAALAALPMLIIYMSLMWTIVLAGVQVGYAVQNVNDLGPPKQASAVEHGAHRRLALALAVAACREKQVELTEFTQAIDVPRGWVDGVVNDLVGAHVLELEPQGDQEFVRPARPAEDLTVWDVFLAVEGREGDREIVLPEAIEASLDDSRSAVRRTLAEVALGE